MKLLQTLSQAPSPAIVSKQGARRLSRWALLLIVLAYVCAGFFGHTPWKSNDISSTGLMLALAKGESSWWHPTLLGLSPDTTALLPYWLGAWSIQIFESLLGVAQAARMPFVAMLAGALTLTWFGTYYLALNRSAQPVAFAFGGEASPKAYASAVADGALLALMASLGLAQLGHETSVLLAQVFFFAMVFAAGAALRFRRLWPTIGLVLGLTGLSLSGAPALAGLLWLALGAMQWQSQALARQGRPTVDTPVYPPGLCWALLLLAALPSAIAALLTASFAWKLDWPSASLEELQRLGRLMLWFTWPIWPMVVWTLWQWRRHLGAAHLAWPLVYVVISLGQLVLTHSSDWALVMGLPAFASLAAFALPTLTRRISAWVDWFTLVFFTICGLTIWVMWAAMLTGWPEQPASNVRRLVPGFTLEFSFLTTAMAVVATLAWFALVRWRTSRHRSAIWKSLVLPAGGTVWAWVLLMTLWLPVFDYSRGYAPLMAKVRAVVSPEGQVQEPPSCVATQGLTLAQAAALRLHTDWTLKVWDGQGRPQAAQCAWLVSTPEAVVFWAPEQFKEWRAIQTLRRPSDNNEELAIFRRNGQ